MDKRDKSTTIAPLTLNF